MHFRLTATPADGVTDKWPTGRNQNAASIQLNLFNAIAGHRAAVDVASLRYDKRGCGRSAGNYDASWPHNFVADAQDALTAPAGLSELSGVPLFVPGHTNIPQHQPGNRWVTKY